jgi:NAD(P)-dependent dehydrogenase (short-subunit alcohol dehydrogenase family)
MSSQKLIVILGATGNQGSSVIKTFLEHPQYKIRGLTRNTSSDKARALIDQGVEMVAADLDDKASLEAAFAGAHIVFIVSDYWGTLGALASSAGPDQSESLYLKAAEIEKKQLMNALDAAAQVPSLERLVLSSLQNASKWSGGKYEHVYHFEFKARAAEYAAKTYPELWAKTSIFQAGWFTSNYISNPMAMPRNVSRD